MRIANLLLLIALGLLLCFCKKDPEITKPTKTIRLSQEIKDWTLFKPGSYWIERDSVTLKEDSIYVSSVTAGWKVVHRADTILMLEEVKMQFAPYELAWNYIISSEAGGCAKFDFICTQGMFFCLDSTVRVGKEGNGFVMNHTVPDFKEDGLSYGDVRFTYYNYEVTCSSHPKAFSRAFLYWKKHVGLIKKGNFPGFTVYSSRHVVRYKIIQ